MGTDSSPHPEADMDDRLSKLEARLDDLRREVRTGRLVVVDPEGRDRIVAEVRNDQAELRLLIPDRPSGRSCHLVLFADSGDELHCPSLGMQLWGAGNALASLGAWSPTRREWEPVSWVGDE